MLNERKRPRQFLLFTILAFVVVLVVSSSLFWPSVPYRFLADARLDEIRISQEWIGTPMVSMVASAERCTREYFVPGLTGSRIAAVKNELEADGWIDCSVEGQRNLCFTRSNRSEIVDVLQTGELGSFVTLVTEPTTSDRILVWLRRDGRRNPYDGYHEEP